MSRGGSPLERPPDTAAATDQHPDAAPAGSRLQIAGRWLMLRGQRVLGSVIVRHVRPPVVPTGVAIVAKESKRRRRLLKQAS